MFVVVVAAAIKLFLKYCRFFYPILFDVPLYIFFSHSLCLWFEEPPINVISITIFRFAIFYVIDDSPFVEVSKLGIIYRVEKSNNNNKKMARAKTGNRYICADGMPMPKGNGVVVNSSISWWTRGRIIRRFCSTSLWKLLTFVQLRAKIMGIKVESNEWWNQIRWISKQSNNRLRCSSIKWYIVMQCSLSLAPVQFHHSMQPNSIKK